MNKEYWNLLAVECPAMLAVEEFEELLQILPEEYGNFSKSPFLPPELEWNDLYSEGRALIQKAASNVKKGQIGSFFEFTGYEALALIEVLSSINDDKAKRFLDLLVFNILIYSGEGWIRLFMDLIGSRFEDEANQLEYWMGLKNEQTQRAQPKDDEE